MALNTYANLKTAIVNQSHRGELTQDLLDDFIDMTEALMWTMLEIRDMESRQTANASTRFLALPDNFIKMRRMTVQTGGNSYEISYKSPEAMTIVNTSGRPNYFTITSQIEFDKTPDATYTIEMVLLRSLTALSASNTSNAVLSRFPQIYLFGCLYHCFNYAVMEDKADRYYQLFIDAIEKANKQDYKGRFGVAPAMRPENRIV